MAHGYVSEHQGTCIPLDTLQPCLFVISLHPLDWALWCFSFARLPYVCWDKCRNEISFMIWNVLLRFTWPWRWFEFYPNSFTHTWTNIVVRNLHFIILQTFFFLYSKKIAVITKISFTTFHQDNHLFHWFEKLLGFLKVELIIYC